MNVVGALPDRRGDDAVGQLDHRRAVCDVGEIADVHRSAAGVFKGLAGFVHQLVEHEDIGVVLMGLTQRVDVLRRGGHKLHRALGDEADFF